MDARIAAVELARRREDRHLLLLFDFDGTLAPFDPDPDAVYLDDEVRALLAGLALKPRSTVGIISGRRLPDLEKRLKIPGEVYVAGFHGLEIHAPGEAFMHPEAAAAPAVAARRLHRRQGVLHRTPLPRSGAGGPRRRPVLLHGSRARARRLRPPACPGRRLCRRTAAGRVVAQGQRAAVDPRANRT